MTATFETPTPLRVEGAGVCLDASKTPDAIRAILADARVWGILGIDLEWNKDGRITWVGLGTEKRAVSFWWPGMSAEGRKLIADAFAAEDLPKLGQNGIQADRYVWEREVGLTGGTWEDTMLLHHAAFPGVAHDLQQIVSQFLVVPPWKAWRREAMRQADQQRREHAKAEKKATKQAAHQARNADRHAEKEARKAAKQAEREGKVVAKVAAKEQKAAEKSQKQLDHEAKIEAQRVERERKKAERVAAHEARNAALAASGKKARKKTTTAAPPPGAVTPMAPAPAPAPRRDADDEEVPFDVLPANGLLCSVCGEPQRMGPSGETCSNGHGGAPGVEAEPVTSDEVQPSEGFHMLTPEEMGGQDQRHGDVPAADVPEQKLVDGVPAELVCPHGFFQPVDCSECTPMSAPVPPAPPVLEKPRALLRAPAWPGGSLINNKVASLSPDKVRRLTVVVAQPDGSEKIVEVEPEEP